MKILKRIKAYKFYSVLILICFSFVAFKSNYEKSKLISREFNVTDRSIVKIMHERGAQNIEYYDGDKALLEVNLVVRGAVEEDVETVLSKYSIDIDEFSNTVEVNSSTNIKLQQSNTSWFGNTKHLVKFKDGTEIRSKIEMVRATMKLKIPKVSLLELSNRYNDINTGDLPFDLNVDLFSGEIDAGNIDGKFEMDMKYGKGKVGNVNEAKLDLFDSDLRFGNIGELKLKDKYSEIEFANVMSVEMDVFDAELSFGNIPGAFNIREKYSEIEAGNVGTGEWDMFDAQVKIESIEQLEVNSKYSEFVIERVGDLSVESFDDDFKLGNTNSVESRYSKYTEYDIEELNSFLKFQDSFDDDIDIRKVGAAFSGINLVAKYTDLNCPIPSSIKYNLQAEMKYGELKYPEQQFEVRIDRERGSERNLEAKTAGANENSPKVFIDAYSSKISLSGF